MIFRPCLIISWPTPGAKGGANRLENCFTRIDGTIMSQEVITQLKSAIEQVRNWPTAGWKVTFGLRETEVNSLPAAMEMPKEFQHREEAVAYWRNIEGMSKHITPYLEAALEAMEKGDLKLAEDKSYFAHYFEKPLERDTQTCKNVWESIRDLSA